MTATTTKICHESDAFQISQVAYWSYMFTQYPHGIPSSVHCTYAVCNFYTFMLHSQLFFFSFGDQIKWVICSALVLFTPPPMP